MSKVSRKRLWLFGVAFLVGAVAGLAYWFFRANLQPMPPGAPFYIRYESSKSLKSVLKELHARKVVRHAGVWYWDARLKRQVFPIQEGTYEVKPGLSPEELLKRLRRPIKQLVRIPEGWWAARVAKLLEAKGVCKAEEYLNLVKRPEAFQGIIGVGMPSGSLEGYLYPDTYDLPPLLGAQKTIEKQLEAFQKKVASHVERKQNLGRAVTIAAMIEQEVSLDKERPIVAGIIENRLKKGMKLQIDATVLYALGEWKVLGPGVVNTVDSPYNTYRVKGLPPGPIGSPSWKSIQAALNPAKHDYLYYVALPNRSHLFASTYEAHQQNIRKRLAAIRGAGAVGGMN